MTTALVPLLAPKDAEAVQRRWPDRRVVRLMPGPYADLWRLAPDESVIAHDPYGWLVLRRLDAVTSW